MKKVLVYGLKNIRGGLERYLLSLHEQIRDDISMYYMVEQSNCIHQEQIENWGGKIIYLPPRHPVGNHVRSLDRMLREYREEIDTLYINVNGISFDIAVILLGRFHGYRVVVHSHNAMMEPIKHPIYRALHKSLEFAALAILKRIHVTRLAVSKKASQYLFGNKESVLAVPGIRVDQYKFDINKRNHIRKKLGVQNQTLFGFVGRLTAVKQPDLVLKIFQEIRKHPGQMDAHLVMIGSGPMYEELVQYVALNGLENAVTFTVEINNPANYYMAMDYLLLPSLSEGLSLVAIEAQTSGLPVACSDGRFPDVIRVTDLVNFISLEKDAAYWANACLAHKEKFNQIDRKQWGEKISASPFELKKSVYTVKNILLDNM